jgi:hypothetical protein
MTDAKLTNLQFSTLAALWMQPSSGVPNTYFTNVLHIGLKAAARDELRDAKLIDVVQKKKGARIEAIKLTGAGRSRLRDEAGLEPIGRPGAGDRVLRALVSAFGDQLDDTRNLPELLDDARAGREAAMDSGPASTVADTEDMQVRIRKAYGALAQRAGAWVMLAKVRDALGSADRTDVDKALLQLSREPGVDFIPESNQKVLTPEERAAAFPLGNQHMHLLSIRS